VKGFVLLFRWTHVEADHWPTGFRHDPGVTFAPPTL
jgi:hypothetical protein